MQQVFLPAPGERTSRWVRLLHRTIAAGARLLPS
jgi:hypothetical protein